MSGVSGGVRDADAGGAGLGGASVCRRRHLTDGQAGGWCWRPRAGGPRGGVAGVEAAAGGGGRRKMAGVAGRAGWTVRGWVRRFAGRAEEVRVFFTVLLARTGPDPVMPAGAAGPVAAAVSAIAGAAVAVAARWPLLGEVPVWTAASAASGGLLLAPGWPGGGATRADP